MNPRTYFTPSNGYNPRFGARRYASKTPVSTVSYSTQDVWAAAAAAQRINGEYLKESVSVYDAETGKTNVVKHRNRDVMADFLQDPSKLTEQDRVQGSECRQYLKGRLLMQALAKGSLSDFDQAMNRVVEFEQFTDVSRLELAIVASAPSSWHRGIKQDEIDALGRGSTHVGVVGSKVTLSVKVVRSNFSQKFGIWFITALTGDNQLVFFSYRNSILADTGLSVTGTIKQHTADNRTQLNRVRVVFDAQNGQIES